MDNEDLLNAGMGYVAGNSMMRDSGQSSQTA